jgi:hypothetical protein
MPANRAKSIEPPPRLRVKMVHFCARSIASPNSRERFVAASTAFMSVVRIPPSSSVCNPVMAVPPGEVTMSLSRPGCSLVSSSILAEPRRVCAARSCAVRRDSPTLTPASLSASRIRKTYAGPEDDRDADSVEDPLGLFKIGRSRMLTGRDRRRRRIDQRRRIGHGSHHRDTFNEARLNRSDRNSGSDGDHQRIRTDQPSHLVEHPTQNLRLHRQDDDIRRRGLTIVGRGIDPEPLPQLGHPFLPRSGHRDLLRLEMSAQEAANERLRHVSRTKEADGFHGGSVSEEANHHLYYYSVLSCTRREDFG